MISKLTNWLSNKSDEQENSPEEALASLLDELNLAYEDCSKSINEARKNQENILKQYETLSNDLKKCTNECIKEKNRGNIAKSEHFAQKGAIIQEQLKDYKRLLTDVCNTVYQLERQAGKIKLKIDQANSKKTMLSAKLTQAENNITINKQLLEIENSEEFREFEDTIKTAEAKAEAIAYLNNESYEIDQAIEPKVDFEEHLTEELNSKIEETNKNLKKVLNRVFKENTTQPPQIASIINKKLDEFKHSKEEVSLSNKVKSMNSFFTQEVSKERNSTEKSKIHDFFESSENTSPQEKQSQDIKDFFNSENTTTHQKKKINDFFKD